jgi:hypothetical protein
MVDKLRYAQDLFSSEMAELQRKHPDLNLPSKSKILEILAAGNTKVGKVNATGLIEIDREVRIEREVAVQDARTTALLNSLARHVKRIHTKYPKLKQEMDPQVQEYLSS